MFENHRQALAPRTVFFVRLMRSIAVGMLLIAIALFMGMAGYHYFEHMSWVDAFVNAAMILSGMGPLGTLATEAGKIFAGFYALFSGLLFILIISIVFAPVIHRYFHKFHLDANTRIRDRDSNA
jgi:hypothetical protein